MDLLCHGQADFKRQVIYIDPHMYQKSPTDTANPEVADENGDDIVLRYSESSSGGKKAIFKEKVT